MSIHNIPPDIIVTCLNLSQNKNLPYISKGVNETFLRLLESEPQKELSEWEYTLFRKKVYSLKDVWEIIKLTKSEFGIETEKVTNKNGTFSTLVRRHFKEHYVPLYLLKYFYRPIFAQVPLGKILEQGFNGEIKNSKLEGDLPKLAKQYVELSKMNTAINYNNMHIKEVEHILRYIFTIEKLKKIVFSSGLIRLPPSSDIQSSITELNFSDNKLSNCIDFTHFKNLKILIMANNAISSVVLPKSGSKIEVLNFSSNNLTEFPLYIEKLQSLKEIYLRENEIEAVPLSLDGNENINKIDISDNKIKFFFPLNTMKQLSKIYVAGNTITEIDANVFWKEISVGRNPISFKNISMKFSDITYLDLSGIKGVNLGKIGAQSNITHLFLSNCGIRNPDELFEGKLAKTLTTLDLSSNEIFVVDKIIKCFRLCELNIKCTKISKINDDIYKLQNLRILKYDSDGISSLPIGLKIAKDRVTQNLPPPAQNNGSIVSSVFNFLTSWPSFG